MSGFSSIVGFMFSFFVIMGLFISAFSIYHEQLMKQTLINDVSAQKLDTNLNLNFKLELPFVYSGMVGFNVDNYGSKDLMIKNSNDKSCIDIFVNSENFLKKSDFFFAPLYDISKDYRYIKSGKRGVLFIKGYNLSQIKSLKIISCEGKVFQFNFEGQKPNFWNSNWLLRKDITVTNNYKTNLNEYQVEVKLNKENFDFSKANENSIRCAFNLGQNLVLDVPMNNNSQQIRDYSKYNNVLYLGSDASVENSDPIFVNNSVLFGGYKFDGKDDAIYIKANNSLLIDNQISMFAWVKWNGAGDSLQNIFTNGVWSNALRIVNDGSANQNKILFQLSLGGNTKYLYSNSTIKPGKWYLIGGVYNGKNMKIYINGKLNSESSNYNKFIDTNYGPNYIGTEGSNFYFNGTLDEVKVFDIALKASEVKDLMYNIIDKRVMNYYTVNFDKDNQVAKIFVKIPRLLKDSYFKFGLYYDYDSSNILNSASNISSTFSYFLPRKVGIVVNERLSSTTGVSFMSLHNDNNLTIGSNSFILNNQQGGTIPSSNINSGDNVSVEYPSQVEGDGDYTDIISPVSWAGKEFYYRGFRNNADRFCMISPWTDSFVKMYDNGVLVWNGSVNSTVNCVTYNIGTNDNLRIKSDFPIMISYSGSNEDAFNFYPATNNDLFGVPSNNFYLAAGPNGSSVTLYRSSGAINSYSVASNGTLSIGGNGANGNSPAFRVVSTNPVGAIQEADSDGVEASVFVPRQEFGTIFGSHFSTDYIAVVSNFPDANCSVYNSSGSLIGNQVNGIGSNGIYKYNFGVGNNNNYVSADWELKCKKPVWPYYEKTQYQDETNLLGELEMRQYVFPSPTLSIN